MVWHKLIVERLAAAGLFSNVALVVRTVKEHFE